MTIYKHCQIIFVITLLIQISLCTNADITEFPGIISVRYKSDVKSPFTHICSGSILNESVILTSASCFANDVTKVTTYQIVAGSDIYDGSMGAVALVERIVKNYQYKTNNVGDDLALVFLKTPFRIDNARIAMPSLFKRQLNDGSVLDVSGWNSDAQAGSRLQKSSLGITNCDQYNKIVCGAPTKLCENGIGSLLWLNMELVGILSKNGDCNSGVESFTSVLASMDWIQRTLNGEDVVALKPEFL